MRNSQNICYTSLGTVQELVHNMVHLLNFRNFGNIFDNVNIKEIMNIKKIKNSICVSLQVIVIPVPVSIFLHKKLQNISKY